jgi:CRP/FNR family transcriptional regulator
MILKIAQPGDVLGLSAMISGACHEATAETIEPTQIKRIRKAEFVEFLTMHGEASLHASQALSLESRRAFLDIRRLALSGSAAGRLASLLLDWGRGACRPGSEMRFAMTLTHEEIAALAGTTRETITRTLRRFQNDDLIRIAGYSILILSPGGLESILD